MAIHSDIRDQAYGFFIQEAPELLQVIETELLQLRQDRTTARVHALMRAAHSIKGGAANVGLEAIKILAHRLEDCFRAFYNEELQLDDQLEALLLQGYDRLRIPLLEAIQLGDAFDGEAAVMAAEPVLQQIELLLGDFLLGEDHLPTVAEMGIDIAQTIFETDVAEQLSRLAALSPDHPLAMGELRAVADVLQGIAELLNFSGLAELTQLTLTALETNPHQATEIFQAALVDFQAAHQAVLQGDRQQGGSPSLALRQLAQARSSDGEEILIVAEQSAELSLEEVFTLPPQEAESLFLESVFMPTVEESESFSLESIFAPIEDSSAPSLESVFAAPGEETAVLPPESIFVQVNEEHLSLSDTTENACAGLEPVFAASPELEVTPDSGDPLALALTRIEQDFESLPAVAESLTQAPPVKPQSGRRKKNRPQPQSPASEQQLSVRLELSQLERMNNQLSELSINRNSLSLQNEQLQDALQNLQQRFGQFLGLGNQLRSQLNKLLVSPDRYSPSRQALMPLTQGLLSGLGKSAELLADQRGDFDSLELDSYSEIYNLLQDAMECILQLEESVGDVTLFAERSDRTLEQQGRTLTGLRDELMWARMLPLENILNRFPRQLRELSLKYKKPVDMQLSGTGVLVDKAVLEKLYDPLLHLLRNAFDHGIEDPQTRLQQGKPERGQIQIHAYHLGSRTLIEVRDDGRGINLERVRSKALDLGLLTSEEASTAPTNRLLDLLFEPGFSTASQVSELSGRGVGLDIVRAQLQALKGSISVSSQPGQGTTFTLRIPLTLSISKLMLVWSGLSAVALPSDSIEEVINPQPQMLKQSNGQRFLLWRQQVIPIHSLQALLPYNCPLPEGTPPFSMSVPTPDDWASPLLVLRQGGQLFALEVERLLTEQELVIKPFSNALAAPDYFYGCTILGDGLLIPVIDGMTLLSGAGERRQPSSNLPVPPRHEGLSQQSTILIVDDSAGMRQTLSLTLEKAGYRVLQARDGREAIDQLQQNSQVKLVICDVEMPVMNGFEFLTHRRQHPSMMQVPVVMLTSRGGAKHRQLAQHLGATDYFTKPYIEQQFLTNLKTLLQGQRAVSQSAL